MDIRVIGATEEDFPVVQNLVRFYVYDMSETMGWVCPEDGLYGGCDDLPEYWWTGSTVAELQAITEKFAIAIPYNMEFDRWPAGHLGHAFMVRVDGELAGFALVKEIATVRETNYDIGEFFIVRKFRRRGVGRTVAEALFDRFAGRWQVRQLLGNDTAQAFWRRVIADYSRGDYEESVRHIAEYGIDMVAQVFKSRECA